MGTELQLLRSLACAPKGPFVAPLQVAGTLLTRDGGLLGRYPLVQALWVPP